MAKTAFNKKRVTFSLTAPGADTVSLVGCFTEWDKSPASMKRQKNGVWKTTISLKPGTYEYRFIVDGLWQDDPACKTLRPNSFGSHNCVCEVV
jgi:5'-AMP-activated protein kinase regulatory beta subunit